MTQSQPASTEPHASIAPIPPTEAAPDAQAAATVAPAAGPGTWRRVAPALRSMATTLGLFALAFVAMTTLVGGPIANGTPLSVRGRDVEGRAFDAASLHGKPTVLYIWATWCPACKATTPTIDSFARRHPDVNVLAIAAEEAGPVLAALAETPRSFRTVADDGVIASSLGVRALPTTILLDAEGRVRWNRQGVLLPFELDARSL